MTETRGQQSCTIFQHKLRPRPLISTHGWFINNLSISQSLSLVICSSILPFVEGFLRMVKRRNVSWVIKEASLSNPTKWCQFCFQHFKIIVHWKETSFLPSIFSQRATWIPGSVKYPHVCQSGLLRNRWFQGLSIYKKQIGKYDIQLINSEADAGPLVLSRYAFISIWFLLLSFKSSFPLYSSLPPHFFFWLLSFDCCLLGPFSLF